MDQRSAVAFENRLALMLKLFLVNVKHSLPLQVFKGHLTSTIEILLLLTLVAEVLK
jgi:hypothetical protein